MKKSVVIYKSNYGSTKRYAQWISNELSCPVFEQKDMKPQALSNYDIIISGGGLYAGGVNGLKMITRNRKLLSNKRVILFTCGIADPNNLKNISHIRESLSKALPSEMFEQIKFFHLRGKMDYSRLTFFHSTMMSMLRKMLLKKDAGSLSEEDKQLLATYGQCIDFTDYESIFPLTSYVKSL